MNYFDYSSAHLHAWVSDPTAPRDSDGQLLPAVVAKAVRISPVASVRQPTDEINASHHDGNRPTEARAPRSHAGDLDDWKTQHDNRHPGFLT